MEGDANPYQVPNARLEPTWDGKVALGGSTPTVWREGDHLVARVDATLPAHCIKCGAQSITFHKRRQFYWHTPWLFVLVLLSPLIYCLAALFARKSSRHQVGLCEPHARRRRAFVWIAWACVPVMIAGAAIGEGWSVGVGLLTGLVLLIVGMFGMRTLTPVRIDATRARFRGVSKAYLDRLPTRPDTRR